MSNLSRRDEFAKAAMQGILSFDYSYPDGQLAKCAIACADALLAALGDEPVFDEGGPKVPEHWVITIEDVKAATAEIASLKAELAKYTCDLTDEQAQAAWDLWDGVGDMAMGMKIRDVAIRKVRAGGGE